MARFARRFAALGYLTLLIVFPVAMVFWRALEPGIGGAWDAVTSADALHALWLSLIVALVATVLNTVFGVVCALWVVRRGGRVARVVEAFLDIPLALSPVVVGLALLLVYGRTGWLGPWLSDHGIQVLFSWPSIVLATVFVSLPFVARETIPVLRELGDEQEQAAATLGAGTFATFRRITLPAIRPAAISSALVRIVSTRHISANGGSHYGRKETSKALSELLDRLDTKAADGYARMTFPGKAVGKSSDSLHVAVASGIVSIPFSEIEALRPIEGGTPAEIMIDVANGDQITHLRRIPDDVHAFPGDRTWPWSGGDFGRAAPSDRPCGGRLRAATSQTSPTRTLRLRLVGATESTLRRRTVATRIRRTTTDRTAGTTPIERDPDTSSLPDSSANGRCPECA